MSEPSPASVQPATKPPRKSTWVYTLAFITLLIAGAGGYYYYEKTQNAPPPVDEIKGIKEYCVRLAGSQKLAEGYTDTNKDLVADTPKDDAKLIKLGDELTFTAVGSDDPVKAAEEWKPLLSTLEKATGKKVKYLDEVRSVDEQFAAVHDGKLHITAFNTGAVPTAVNTAGFVPLFAPADKDSKSTIEMVILVRSDDPATGPQDLRARRVGFVALSSNSGAKAPLLVLRKTFELSPGHDYNFGFTGEHIRSVKELIAGNYDAVCVASDMLRKGELAGTLDPSKYKVIYKSDPFPPLCFGIPHNLPPDLRKKIEDAFAAFKFDPSSPSGRQGKTGFASVNYLEHWKFVREIDDQMTRLFDRE